MASAPCYLFVGFVPSCLIDPHINPASSGRRGLSFGTLHESKYNDGQGYTLWDHRVDEYIFLHISSTEVIDLILLQF